MTTPLALPRTLGFYVAFTSLYGFLDEENSAKPVRLHYGCRFEAAFTDPPSE